MGNFFSDLLGGGSKTVQPITIDPRNPQRASIDQFIANFVNKNGGNYGQPYTGSYVAPLTGYENQGLSSLQSYLNGPDVTPGQSNIQNYLQGLISNPSGSPQNAAFSAAADYNNANAVNQANADFGKRGNFFSTAAVNKIGDINAQTAIAKNTNLANLQSGAIGPATSLEAYLAGVPLQKTSAALSYGSLPRQLDQADLESQYQDFIRQQDQVKSALGGTASNTQVTQGYPLPNLTQNNGTGTGNLFGQITSLLGNPSVQGAGQSIGQGISTLLPMLMAFL